MAEKIFVIFLLVLMVFVVIAMGFTDKANFDCQTMGYTYGRWTIFEGYQCINEQVYPMPGAP